MQADYRADMTRRDEQWQRFLEQKDEIWRNFITELVERSSEAEDMTSQRLTELALITKTLVDEFKTHDAKTSAGMRKS